MIAAQQQTLPFDGESEPSKGAPSLPSAVGLGLS